jgi:hypothetical protein
MPVQGYPEEEIRETPRIAASPTTRARYIVERWIPQDKGHFVSLEKREIPQSGKRRPMVFSSDRAYGHLRATGLVLSIRSELKPEGPVWIRRSRTAPKSFDATRRLVAVLDNEEEFGDYVRAQYDKSGFESAEEWAEAYIGHQGDIQTPAYVYVVETDGEEGGER